MTTHGTNCIARVCTRLADLDRVIIQSVAERPPALLDPILRRLTVIADDSKLWLLIGATLAISRGTSRRAACCGFVSLAATSIVTSGLTKAVWRRHRPTTKWSIPSYRRLHNPPRSSSFPSGHAASAVGFTVAVATVKPALGTTIAPLAGTAAYSRVHTGAYWPSDVVAGALVGLGIGLFVPRGLPRFLLPSRSPSCQPNFCR